MGPVGAWPAAGGTVGALAADAAPLRLVAVDGAAEGARGPGSVARAAAAIPAARAVRLNIAGSKAGEGSRWFVGGGNGGVRGRRTPPGKSACGLGVRGGAVRPARDCGMTVRHEHAGVRLLGLEGGASAAAPGRVARRSASPGTAEGEGSGGHMAGVVAAGVGRGDGVVRGGTGPVDLVAGDGGGAGTAAVLPVAHVVAARLAGVGHLTEGADVLRGGEPAAPQRAGEVPERLVVVVDPPVAAVVGDGEGGRGAGAHRHPGPDAAGGRHESAAVVAGRLVVDPVVDEQVRLVVAVDGRVDRPADLDDGAAVVGAQGEFLQAVAAGDLGGGLRHGHAGAGGADFLLARDIAEARAVPAGGGLGALRGEQQRQCQRRCRAERGEYASPGHGGAFLCVWGELPGREAPGVVGGGYGRVSAVGAVGGEQQVQYDGAARGQPVVLVVAGHHGAGAADGRRGPQRVTGVDVQVVLVDDRAGGHLVGGQHRLVVQRGPGRVLGQQMRGVVQRPQRGVDVEVPGMDGLAGEQQPCVR